MEEVSNGMVKVSVAELIEVIFKRLNELTEAVNILGDAVSGLQDMLLKIGGGGHA